MPHIINTWLVEEVLSVMDVMMQLNLQISGTTFFREIYWPWTWFTIIIGNYILLELCCLGLMHHSQPNTHSYNLQNLYITSKFQHFFCKKTYMARAIQSIHHSLSYARVVFCAKYNRNFVTSMRKKLKFSHLKVF